MFFGDEGQGEQMYWERAMARYFLEEGFCFGILGQGLRVIFLETARRRASKSELRWASLMTLSCLGYVPVMSLSCPSFVLKFCP